MNRRILYIILGLLLLLALILGLWFWFFSRGPAATNQPSNLFGTGSDKNGNGGTGNGGGNNQAPIGSNTGTGAGTGNTSGNTSTGNTSTNNTSENLTTNIDTGGQLADTTPTPGADADPDKTPDATPEGDPDATPTPDPDPDFVDNPLGTTTRIRLPGVTWDYRYLTSTSTIRAFPKTVFFNPTAVTTFQTDTITGTPHITKVTGADGKEIDLSVAGFAVAILGCIAQYSGALTTVGAQLSGPISALTIAKGDVQTHDSLGEASADTGNISSCLARTIGRAAVQALTDSVVNWINNGFEGKPAFVENFNKFFADVGDQAAGEFLQSSNFAFLCSPFKAQVRIALAQSYARRSNAPSCTLSDAVGNVQNFVNGNFAEGGWGGLVSFTNQPNNNPFGAFMTLSGGLQDATGKAQANANLDINLGQGFTSYRQCDPVPQRAGVPLTPAASQQNCKIVTPASYINNAGEQAFGSSFRELELGESIEQIIAALANALVNKALYKGFSNANEDTTGDKTDTPAEAAAKALMAELRAAVTNAQQYGTVEQRIIADVQTAQANLVDLQNCWYSASTTPNLTPAQLNTVKTGLVAAQTRTTQLEALVTKYNQNIKKANASIQKIQELQTDLLLATLAKDVTAVKNTWESIKAGAALHVYTATDVSLAQQDRTTTQGSLASTNIDTSTKLQQCNAIGR
jgi:hypothetical protein